MDAACNESGCGSYIHYETLEFGSNSQYIIINIKLHEKINEQLIRKIKHEIQVENTVQVCGCYYTIVGIICHIGNGNIAQGHYWAYAMEDGRFVRYNDSVRQVTNIAEFRSKHDDGEQPYILLYRKVSPTNNVPVNVVLTGRYVC